MIQLLIDNPLLLLFIVSAIGYAIGRIKIKGSSLGVAAVLFVGLAFGALNPELVLPDIIFQLGLVIFVYTIGLSSGPGFFASFRRKGLRDNVFIFSMIAVAAALTFGASLVLQLKATVAAGMFAGSLTNTPALAGLLETVATAAPPGQLDAWLAEPVVGYSVAYPMGVLVMIAVVALAQTRWRIDYQTEARGLRKFHLVEQDLQNRTARVTQPDVTGVPLRTLRNRYQWEALFSRLKRGESISLAQGDTELQLGDLITVIGTEEEVESTIAMVGEPAGQGLELDRSQYDFRRIFVSNPEVTGRRVADLHLPEKFGAIVTRVRRGDIDLLADGDTVLELGDRVRVVARREELPELGALFGDSYRHLSEVDLLSFGLGLSLGLLVGLIPIPLPGGITFKLGYAGGPLIVALILGALRRTGPIVWTIPYSANLTLRQLGLIFLLAAIGLRSGYTFVTTFSQSGGVSIFLAGVLITSITAVLTLWVGYKILKIPFGMLTGMLSGLQTQPAVLGFSIEQAENDLPNIGYALIFPVATISKIVVAQFLFLLLR